MSFESRLEEKKSPEVKTSGLKKMAMTYSPGYPVPSALLSLTSLFGMGRGEPQCNNHHKPLSHSCDLFRDIKKKENILNKNKSYTISRKLTGN